MNYENGNFYELALSITFRFQLSFFILWTRSVTTFGAIP